MAATTANWRTIDVDALDPEASCNFDIASLAPAVATSSAADVQAAAAHVRQALRGGDGEGALRDALALAPFGADDRGKEVHLAAVMEILQSIRQADMSPMLGRIYKGESGSELLDTLMKYMYVAIYPFCAIPAGGWKADVA
jgi:actin related protein 2/3 complex, subunit 5